MMDIAQIPQDALIASVMLAPVLRKRLNENRESNSRLGDSGLERR
jgi:hypothetical protein